ncbi:MAG TPA: type II toxin-antitoxin system RelE/ParE family toxin [Acetobacteraceae bacterium]|nr:type II toxin-antitoxin system RelE/ParE family toxin [Acetobacteraceae bacterium]
MRGGGRCPVADAEGSVRPGATRRCSTPCRRIRRARSRPTRFFRPCARITPDGWAPGAVHSVSLAPEAQTDLIELYAYIAAHGSPERALAYVERIEVACRGLATFPERGTRRDDIRPGLPGDRACPTNDDRLPRRRREGDDRPHPLWRARPWGGTRRRMRVLT